MKRLFMIAAAALAVAGCAEIRNARNENPYERPFYAKYLNTGSALDASINRTLEGLRANPDSPELHNQLGALLVEKGFPKDAEREFERAVDADRKFFPGWYNLGLVRAAHGDELGARRAFARTVDLKPGHSAALFQLGLVEEKDGHIDRAVELYAKAFSINPALLDVRVNPRILDTKLTHLAMLRLYPKEHARRSMAFHGSPAPAATTPARDLAPPAALSPEAAPQRIIPPSPPATSPAVQPAVPTPPQNVTPVPPATRRRRTTTPAPQPEAAPVPPPIEPTIVPNATPTFGQAH